MVVKFGHWRRSIIHDINVLWNNGYRHVFNCCWHESVKPLQYYSNNLPLSYLIEERQLLFYKKLYCSNNSILRALMSLPAVYYEVLSLASKYHINTVHYSVSVVKEAVWSEFVSRVVF